MPKNYRYTCKQDDAEGTKLLGSISNEAPSTSYGADSSFDSSKAEGDRILVTCVHRDLSFERFCSVSTVFTRQYYDSIRGSKEGNIALETGARLQTEFKEYVKSLKDGTVSRKEYSRAISKAAPQWLRDHGYSEYSHMSFDGSEAKDSFLEHRDNMIVETDLPKNVIKG